MINLNKNNNKGFTLIELLVALTVFSIIVIGMTNTTLSIMKGQRKAFSLQVIQESSRYVLETMIKEIRMGIVNSAEGTGLHTLEITNSSGEDVEYQFLSNKLRKSINGGAWQDLSTSNVDLTGSFYIRKSIFPNRALVTIVIKVKSKESKEEERSEIYIQNSMTSRAH